MNLIHTFTLYFCNIHLGIAFCHTRGSLQVLQDTILCALVISASELPSFCKINDDYRRYFFFFASRYLRLDTLFVDTAARESYRYCPRSARCGLKHLGV